MYSLFVMDHWGSNYPLAGKQNLSAVHVDAPNHSIGGYSMVFCLMKTKDVLGKNYSTFNHDDSNSKGLLISYSCLEVAERTSVKI